MRVRSPIAIGPERALVRLASGEYLCVDTSTLEALGYDPPRGRTLRKVSLGGDLVSNGLYYGLVALGDERHTWRRGIILGLLAGLGAALLPPVIGLGDQPHRRTPWTQLLTVVWYTLAGVVAAGAAKAVEDEG